MSSDRIYAPQKSLHRYSAATLSALSGWGLDSLTSSLHLHHDLTQNQQPEHQRAPVSSSHPKPLLCQFKVWLDFFLKTKKAMLNEEQAWGEREKQKVMEKRW